MENFIFCETLGVIEEDRFEQNHSKSYYFTDPLREKKHKSLLISQFLSSDRTRSTYRQNVTFIVEFPSFFRPYQNYETYVQKAKYNQPALNRNVKIVMLRPATQALSQRCYELAVLKKNCNSVQKNNCHRSPSAKPQIENIYAFSSTS